MSNLETMQRLFPKCPICGSEEGYRLSAFYPNIQCENCMADWLLHEDGMELKGTSNQRWDEKLLNKKLPFEYWRELVKPGQKEIEIVEKEFGPMTFVGGTADLGTIEYSRAETDYKSPAFGFLALKTEFIEFKTIEGSTHKMQLKIPIEKVRDVCFKTGKDITFLRYALIGSWAFLLKKRRQFLELTYEDSSSTFKHLFFDFNCNKEIALELMLLANLMRKKHQTP